MVRCSGAGSLGIRSRQRTPWRGWSGALRDLSQQSNLRELSTRDREIAILTSEGRTAKEIARLLELSPRTVETYLAKLKHKLDVRNVAELVSRIRPEGEPRQV